MRRKQSQEINDFKWSVQELAVLWHPRHALVPHNQRLTYLITYILFHFSSSTTKFFPLSHIESITFCSVLFATHLISQRSHITSLVSQPLKISSLATTLFIASTSYTPHRIVFTTENILFSAWHYGLRNHRFLKRFSRSFQGFQPLSLVPFHNHLRPLHWDQAGIHFESSSQKHLFGLNGWLSSVTLPTPAAFSAILVA